MYNYWASTLTEKFGLAPKTPFIGAVGQFTTARAAWKDANKKNTPFLEYDPIDVNQNIVPAPQRQGPTPMEAAYFQQMQTIEHDVQTSLGMFKAATGESESQQSGRAILALQKESDTGTYHFGANLGVSIRHVGRIIVDMIPHYYDTKRVVRIIGEDGEIQTAQIDPDQEMSHREVQGANGGIKSIYNPGVGKWDVSITTGPSYNTQRMEAQATFVEMAKGAADPASAAVLRYLVMRNSDAAGSDEASKLLKTLLPPQALQALASKDPIPPQVQAMLQQVQAKMAQMQEEFQKVQQENVQLKAGIPQAQIKAQSEERIETMRTQSEAAAEDMRLRSEAALERMQQQAEARQAALERMLQEAEARRESDFKRWEAMLEARTKIEVAHIGAEAKEQARPATQQ